MGVFAWAPLESRIETASPEGINYFLSYIFTLYNIYLVLNE